MFDTIEKRFKGRDGGGGGGVESNDVDFTSWSCFSFNKLSLNGTSVIAPDVLEFENGTSVNGPDFRDDEKDTLSFDCCSNVFEFENGTSVNGPDFRDVKGISLDTVGLTDTLVLYVGELVDIGELTKLDSLSKLDSLLVFFIASSAFLLHKFPILLFYNITKSLQMNL